ncbi:MAG: RNA methyltransferase [Agarilytica sp.]
MNDSDAYVEKKKFFSTLLTIYGRKPVLEALSTPGIKVHKLHLSDSNKPATILDEITQLANAANAEILYHSRDALSRISKNKKQDQGVAVDIKPRGFQNFEDFINTAPDGFELIALDNVTNPQNLGMIIRSVCASPMTGLLLPEKGCAKLDALVIKASAGTLFKAKIIRCDKLSPALKILREQGAAIIGLDLNTKHTLPQLPKEQAKVFVLGNETDGISEATQQLCTKKIKIPMANDVESLNVAITAGIIAFRSVL